MDVRKTIRRIISEVYENQEDQNEINPMREKAKRALVALSKNEIPKSDIKYLYGHLSGADFDETGSTGHSGEVEIVWMFEGEEFAIFPDVYASFHYTEGSSGYWGSSVDDSEAPYGSESDDEEITLEGDEIVVWDGDGEEYEFQNQELGKEVKSGIENMLLDYYDPLEEQIGSSK